jgi:PKD repeat protein
VGSFTVTLTVTDDSGLSDTAASTADISDVLQQAPVADPNGPYTGTVGDPVTFDGSGSSDPDGTIVAYDWDFGDGNTGTGVSPTHSYSSVGSYTVTLTVTDDSGLSDTATSTADIAAGPQPPVADPNGPYTGTVGSAVQFDGTGSFDPDGGAIVSYEWDFGDGTTGSGATPTHSYATAGTYSVSLTVTDDEGVTDTGTTSAAIAELGPVDLDISKFKVSKNVKLGKKAVRIDLTVRNAGDVDESAQAVVTGVQNGVTVYSQAKDVSDAPGNGHTKWAFPGYTPTATGHIDWTATIADGDPDDDTATATTTVR